MKNKKRVGIFSGTFDPFHIAHLEACLVARAACDLGTVLIMVEKKPKRKYEVSTYKRRVTMVDLATSEFPSLRLIETGKDNITIDNTLPLLHDQFPGAEYWYIVGSDIVKHLHTWHKPEKLFNNLKLCVVLRENKDKEDVKAQLASLQKIYKKLDYKILPEVWSVVSSSKIRTQIKKTGYSPLLHREVMRYILTKDIY